MDRTEQDKKGEGNKSSSRKEWLCEVVQERSWMKKN